MLILVPLTLRYLLLTYMYFIMQRFSGLSSEDSRDCLLRSIYNTDNLSEEIRERSISSHIETATPLSQVQYSVKSLFHEWKRTSVFTAILLFFVV